MPETSATTSPVPANGKTPIVRPSAFPRAFWVANVTELCERAAYYAMASFVVIYLGRIGLGDYWPSTLNGLLWFLVYFLPVLAGTLADTIGFRRSLLVACVLLAAGYFMMGAPVWIGGVVEATRASAAVTASSGVVGTVVLAILLIGMGGAIVKPCISGTVQKTHAGRATLAFAVFYMVINIGSLVGRFVAFSVRRAWAADLSVIFAVAVVAIGAAFVVVAFFFRDAATAHAPETPSKAPLGPAAPAPAPRRSVRRILLDMVLVLRNRRFALFLLVSSGFSFLYSQVYNILPLYVKRVVEVSPAMDLYTAANPICIVAFQLLVTRLFGKMPAIRSMIIGMVIISVSMAVNLWPLFAAGDLRTRSLSLLPLGSLFIVLTVALIAFGELFTSPRTYEWIGALAPKGKEGLFLGYAQLPMAIGSLVGGPVGAVVFNRIMCRGAVLRPDGLLDLDPTHAALGWLLLMAVGLVSAASMWGYNAWLRSSLAQGA